MEINTTTKIEWFYYWIIIGLIMVVTSRIPNPASPVRKSNDNILKSAVPAISATERDKIYTEAVAQVLPAAGLKTNLVIGDMILRLVAAGVIDQTKFKELYAKRDMSETDISQLLTRSSQQPLIITEDNANLWLNIFWAVGLANKTEFNKTSPLNGEELNNYASTGGWTLGQEDGGGVYFNQHEIIKLTPAQEKIVFDIAQNTYRPCCDNSTFFQDCNHGSALLGVLELGAAEGLAPADLYKLAVGFNSFWFPDQYIQTALYFKVVQNQDWQEVDPKVVMSQAYSSARGWSKNVADQIAKIPNLLPPPQESQSCGV